MLFGAQNVLQNRPWTIYQIQYPILSQKLWCGIETDFVEYHLKSDIKYMKQDGNLSVASNYQNTIPTCFRVNHIN